MEVSRWGFLYSADSLSVIRNLFHAFYFVFHRQLCPLLISTPNSFRNRTIKRISNYTRGINHRLRRKVIKFVNSSVKCNVNFNSRREYLKFSQLLLRAFLYSTINVQRLWNESSNFMQRKIKSDLVIYHSIHCASVRELFSFFCSTPEPFSITLIPIRGGKIEQNTSGGKGLNNFLSNFLCIKWKSRNAGIHQNLSLLRVPERRRNRNNVVM